jgi:hypothetical protein
MNPSASPLGQSKISVATLSIPAVAPSFAEFTRQVETAFDSPDTHFYIDTSFLIWVTTLGKNARGEFIAWIDGLGRDRFHIPVWSGHEYLTHHVQGLIATSLTDISDQLRKLADNTYFFLRPFLDEPLSASGRTPQQAKTSAREVFLDMKKLANELSNWTNEHYHDHFSDVVQLIGELGLPGKAVFDSMETIDALERNRFAGRIPPGFQDKKKKERRNKGAPSRSGRLEETETTTGHNRFGDLVFWQEVLLDSQRPEVRTVVVLSNDRKNDWHMGGRANAQIETDLKTMRKSWDPVPEVHPMLALEAASFSDVDKVFLIDSPYLAAFFHDSGAACEAFVSAALTVELPHLSKKVGKQRRKEYRANSLEGAPRKALFHDGAHLEVGEFPLQRYFASRAELPAVDAFLATALENNAVGKPLTDFMEESLQSMSALELVRLARRIHGRAIANDPLATAFVSDLAGLFPDLAGEVATCLYFGMLCSVYFSEDNGPRLPPSSLMLDELSGLSVEPYAKLALRALNAVANRQQRKALYVISPEQKPVEVRFIPRDELVSEQKFIVGMMIDGVETLTQSQGDEAWRLSTLFRKKSRIKGEELVVEACRAFGVPLAMVAPSDDRQQEFEYEASTGFEDPSTLSNK